MAVAKKSGAEVINMPSQAGDKPAQSGSRKKGKALHRGKYAPEAFIIPGQDQDGNSVRVYCRIVPLLDRAIDMLLSGGKFPFRTKGDLLRYAVKTTVERLNELEPVCGSVLAQVDAMEIILRDEQNYHAFINTFNTLAATVSMHMQAQAIGESRRLVAQVKTQILRMEKGYWQDRYLSELEAKFGYLFKGDTTSGAGMGAYDDHGNSGVDVDGDGDGDEDDDGEDD